MPRWNPNGSLCVVTGASSGIGRHLTLLLLRKGADVLAIARRQERLDSIASELAGESQGELVTLAGDITLEETRRRIADTVANRKDHLDLLVNNAGIGAIGPFSDANESRLRQIMEVNFFAPVELTRLLLPSLKRSPDAVICNISSVLGHRAVPDKSEYCASKFALHGWADSLRSELAGSSVSVTIVSPSTTKSEFFDALVETDPEIESKSIGSWSASRVAHATLKAIERRRGEVILSLGGKLLVYADRLSPPVMNLILAKR